MWLISTEKDESGKISFSRLLLQSFFLFLDSKSTVMIACSKDKYTSVAATLVV